MDLIFDQDNRFFTHDGMNPAPGDDEPKEAPNLEETLEDEFEPIDDDDDDEDDDDDGDYRDPDI